MVDIKEKGENLLARGLDVAAAVSFVYFVKTSGLIGFIQGVFPGSSESWAWIITFFTFVVIGWIVRGKD